MPTSCPTCGQPFLPADVNVAADVAYCRRCEQAWKLSLLVNDGVVRPPAPPSAVDAAALDAALAQPPPGVTFQETARGFTLWATTRSPIAFFLVPFLLVWSGGSLGGVFGIQWVQGKFNPAMSLFSLPFIIGTVFLGSLTLMAICGHVAVRVEDGQGEIFTGVGPLGRRKAFRWDEVTSVQEAATSYSKNGRPSLAIQLDGPAKRVNFGTGLNEARRYFALQALRRMLARR